MSARALVLVLGLVAVAGLAPVAAARSLPVDCLPDAVAAWEAEGPEPEVRFGAQYLPGIVLGPPGGSLPTQNTTSVASFGHAGSAVLALTDIVIEDRPGPDFIVFENAFFQGFAPETEEDPYSVFAEPLIVEVSADGETWLRFPFDAAALAEASGVQSIDRDLRERLVGLAGITPTFAGNWTVPDDPAVWDPAGTGGVSGAGGDAFDLATVGLAEARFVRLIDANARNGIPGAADGADLDALVVLHGRPLTAAGPDSDGDGLADDAELALYGSNPSLPDSDGDGTDDGREVAGCRDPASTSAAAFLIAEPRLWLRGESCTEARWSFAGDGLAYDLIRGALADVVPAGDRIDLGPATCLAGATVTWRHDCDAELPQAGDALYYLVRISAAGGWGRASNFAQRETGATCP